MCGYCLHVTRVNLDRNKKFEAHNWFHWFINWESFIINCQLRVETKKEMHARLLLPKQGTLTGHTMWAARLWTVRPKAEIIKQITTWDYRFQLCSSSVNMINLLDIGMLTMVRCYVDTFFHCGLVEVCLVSLLMLMPSQNHCELARYLIQTIPCPESHTRVKGQNSLDIHQALFSRQYLSAHV